MTQLFLSCYLTEKQPPLDLIVSARAVLAGPDGTVFVFDDNGPHVLPGGRREGAEPVLAALAREIGEEVGCSTIRDPRLSGSSNCATTGRSRTPTRIRIRETSTWSLARPRGP